LLDNQADQVIGQLTPVVRAHVDELWARAQQLLADQVGEGFKLLLTDLDRLRWEPPGPGRPRKAAAAEESHQRPATGRSGAKAGKGRPRARKADDQLPPSAASEKSAMLK
jgi:hypothetical protein